MPDTNYTSTLCSSRCVSGQKWTTRCSTRLPRTDKYGYCTCLQSIKLLPAHQRVKLTFDNLLEKFIRESLIGAVMAADQIHCSLVIQPVFHKLRWKFNLQNGHILPRSYGHSKQHVHPSIVNIKCTYWLKVSFLKKIISTFRMLIKEQLFRSATAMHLLRLHSI